MLPVWWEGGGKKEWREGGKEGGRRRGRERRSKEGSRFSSYFLYKHYKNVDKKADSPYCVSRMQFLSHIICFLFKCILRYSSNVTEKETHRKNSLLFCVFENARNQKQDDTEKVDFVSETQPGNLCSRWPVPQASYVTMDKKNLSLNPLFLCCVYERNKISQISRKLRGSTLGKALYKREIKLQDYRKAHLQYR